MKEILIASNNKGKISEFQDLLPNCNILAQNEFNIVEAEETGLTFVENALLKARNAIKISKMATIADDSGLVVPSLGGQPGIYSARYSGIDASDKNNYQLLLKNLENTEDKSAYFYCCIVMLESYDSPTPIIAEGRMYGQISLTPKGNNGFGYDPVFYIPELNKTAAELTSTEKNKVSHRAKAIKMLLAQMEG